ncbi:MAG: bifunctional diaminohydroxyphosphoribosylaminopyrimidine deaminase/5-amino-6-(5-phosphoribosylamino)uracil reductase RibD [Puniceicoccaceae bacterium]|nr:MAG: bifunctional diaminohydroxyphosphoribosylaminopyrimidine deaminase/5-amino-6-(5-phosphoribosylamino)uracil reductase RibD [Puniceicoccaceae bacterium]
MKTESDREAWMRRALAAARRGWGETHPNPMVGALIVEGGEVVAEGWHRRAGEAHAEVEALRALGRDPAPDAVLVVTLEPCSTTGRTPPCTEAILRSGIRRVVVGAIDPNPAHAGRGLEVLRQAGLTVESRILADDCSDLNLLFNHWMEQGGPLLAAKCALTLDGRIATRTGASRWITGPEARADVMRWRRLFPAIAVGAGTVLADDPRLTSRIEEEAVTCPRRIIFDGLLRVAMAKELPGVFTDEFRDRTVVVTTEQAGTGYARRLEREGVEVWVLPAQGRRVDLGAFRERCREEGILGVYFEGGADLMSELLRRRQLDYLFCYRAPVLLADEKARAAFRGLRTDRLEQALRLEEVRHATFGPDQLIRGRVCFPGKIDVDEALFGDGEPS